MADLLADLRRGRRGAIAKAISAVENDPREARRLIKRIFASSGGSAVVGVTGPAGAGKSSLINRTSTELRRLGMNPAVLAVDPTSHVTGGAILGDRVRMAESADAGTYIRSIASRGSAGAISASLRNSVRILEYAGFDPVIIESVGAGQTEVEISTIADVTVVVFNPHTGDSIQAIKAGLTEVGDIYLVNKSDLPGASRLLDAVRDYIGGEPGGGPAVLRTSAKRNTGIKEFARRLRGLAEERRGRRRLEGDASRLEAELRYIVLNKMSGEIDSMLDSSETFADCLRKMASGKLDPFAAGDRVSRSLMG